MGVWCVSKQVMTQPEDMCTAESISTHSAKDVQGQACVRPRHEIPCHLSACIKPNGKECSKILLKVCSAA
jgi:hypothetical protein